MKTKLFVFFLLSVHFQAFGITRDTLRNYNSQNTLANHVGNFDLRVSRFDLKHLGNLNSIHLITDGLPGSFTLRIFGHEGGPPFPQLEIDLINPISVKKEKNGFEKISVLIEEEIDVTNNQFFIVVENITSGTFIKYDVSTKEEYCSSSNGGNYYYLYNKRGSSWYASNRALAIDVVIDRKDYNYQIPYFSDVSETMQIQGGGNRLAVADYNNDGYDDLLIGGKLFKNDFLNTQTFIDVTSQAGLQGSPLANLFVDMDNDGDIDLLYLESNDSSFIYINDGHANFSKNQITGIPINALDKINAVSMADINNDGYLDLFIGQLWKDYPNALPKFLYINDRNNDFKDYSKLLYDKKENLENAPCRGSQFVDINNDGFPDLYVANYVTTASKISSPRDELWLNNRDGSFSNIINQTGIDTTIGTLFWNMSSGCHWGDYNNDGYMDLLAPSLCHPRFMNGNNNEYTNPTTIYMNTFGNHSSLKFIDTKGKHGIQYEETHAGASWGDINNDGLLDFFISTYYGCRYNDIYIQKSDHSFELVSFETSLHEERGDQDGIWFDFNNDGNLDLLCNGKLYENKAKQNGNFIIISLQSSDGNKQGVGSKVMVYANGQRFTREVTLGHGQKMQSSYRLHFGVGNALQIDSIQVIWANTGETTVYENLKINTLYKLLDNGLKFIPTQTDKTNLYPNPFTKHISITIDWDDYPNFKLFNSLGQEINISEVIKSGKQYIIVPKTITPGTYYIEINAKNKFLRYKILKE